MPPLLEIKNLHIPLPLRADRPYAVEDVSITLSRDEIVCIVGESGSGKSTVAHAILNLLPSPLKVSEGSVALQGQAIHGLGEVAMRKIRGVRIGMVFQEPLSALNPLMRAGDQIAETFAAHRTVPRNTVQTQVLDLLRQVGLSDPERVAQSYPFELSGGQRQRVMIAAALALEPEVLIADEPTTALDVTTQAQVLKLIKDLQRKRRLGVLFITHDFGVVAEIADRIVVMRHGRIVEEGPTAAVLEAPQQAYTRQLVDAVPSLKPPAGRPALQTPTLLELEGVRKIYRTRSGWFGGMRNVEASRGVSLALRRGETYGLVGESGSGKSTLGRMIAGLIHPDAGEIRLGSRSLASAKTFRDKEIRRKIQMVFQDPYSSFNPRRKIRDALIAGSLAAGEIEASATKRAVELMMLVKLDAGVIERYPHEFSGGQRQRLGIARALMMKPEILIADEPVSALDVSVQEQVIRLFAEIKQTLGLTMLFITHDLRVAGQICDRIGVLQRGNLVEEGPPDQVLLAPKHEYTRLLVDAIPGRHWK